MQGTSRKRGHMHRYDKHHAHTHAHLDETDDSLRNRGLTEPTQVFNDISSLLKQTHRYTHTHTQHEYRLYSTQAHL